MNLISAERIRWRKRNPGIRFPSRLLCLIFSFSIFFFLLFYTEITNSLLPYYRNDLPHRHAHCRTRETHNLLPEGERFLWYSPHSGFSNQVSELKNAVIIAAILNRTLIIPPVFDHHAVALGSCPKFRVSSPSELRLSAWDHAVELVRNRRYASMADIIDLSSVLSWVRTIDFRVFTSLWCGLNIDLACFGKICCSISKLGSFSGDFDQCKSMLFGPGSNAGQCAYAIEEDCRTTVWTFEADTDGLLDSFQPDEQIQRKKKISFVRRRRDISQAVGHGSRAEKATFLAFGSTFTAPYKGSELYIDIHKAPRDPRIHSLLQNIEFLPFVPEIIDAGKEFAKKIKKPFLCAQLRLLDGQFKNHWKATFLALKQKIKLLQEAVDGKTYDPINIFVMTDLPSANWSKTYLGELTRDSNAYKIHYLQEEDGLVLQTARKVMAAEHGLRSGFLPQILDLKNEKSCHSVDLPDILLYIEEAICSCASLGFVGTAGSTIAESIELMRKNSVCFIPR